MIKVTIGESKTQKITTFPKLMKLIKHGGIFIAISETQMICISEPNKSDDGDCWLVGEYNDCVAISFFENYNEPITIQNK